MIDIARARLREVSFVAAHMREADRREIWCQWPDRDAATLAWAMTRSSPAHCWAAFERGSPVAAFGLAEQHPGLWQAWAFGTDRLRRAVPAITRHGFEVIRPDLIARSANRVEARSIVGHDIAHRWLESLGARRQCLLQRWGRNGEDFVLYAWVPACAGATGREGVAPPGCRPVERRDPGRRGTASTAALRAPACAGATTAGDPRQDSQEACSTH